MDPVTPEEGRRLGSEPGPLFIILFFTGKCEILVALICSDSDQHGPQVRNLNT